MPRTRIRGVHLSRSIKTSVEINSEIDTDILHGHKNLSHQWSTQKQNIYFRLYIMDEWMKNRDTVRIMDREEELGRSKSFKNKISITSISEYSLLPTAIIDIRIARTLTARV